MQIRIVMNERDTPAGKLADAELHFDQGLLAGLKLVGFAVWAGWGGGRPNVTLPSRDYTKGTERRKFDLLRPIAGNAVQSQALKAAILDAYVAAVNGIAAQVEQTTRRQTPALEQTRRPVQQQQQRPAAAAPRYPTQRPAARTTSRNNEPPPHTDSDYPF